MIWLTDISRADGGPGRGLCPRADGAPQSIFAKMMEESTLSVVWCWSIPGVQRSLHK